MAWRIEEAVVRGEIASGDPEFNFIEDPGRRHREKKVYKVWNDTKRPMHFLFSVGRARPLGAP